MIRGIDFTGYRRIYIVPLYHFGVVVSDHFQKRLEEDNGFILIDSDPLKTENEFQYILFLCGQQVPSGYGALDSFLGGPDIERRVSMIEHEAKQNAYLRSELADTLNLNQSKDWSKDQHQKLCVVAALSAIYDINAQKK